MEVRKIKDCEGNEVFVSVWDIDDVDSVVYSWCEKYGYVIGFGNKDVLIKNIENCSEDIMDFRSVWYEEVLINEIVEILKSDFDNNVIKEFYKKFEEFKKVIENMK